MLRCRSLPALASFPLFLRLAHFIINYFFFPQIAGREVRVLARYGSSRLQVVRESRGRTRRRFRPGEGEVHPDVKGRARGRPEAVQGFGNREIFWAVPTDYGFAGRNREVGRLLPERSFGEALVMKDGNEG